MLKTWIVMGGFFLSLTAGALNLHQEERAWKMAYLSELDQDGQPIEPLLGYQLVVNQRIGIEKHPTSFTFCERAKDGMSKCGFYWVVQPKEALRCVGERYLGWDDQRAAWLELVILPANPTCEQPPGVDGKLKWRVRLHNETATDRFFEGEPRMVLSIMK